MFDIELDFKIQDGLSTISGTFKVVKAKVPELVEGPILQV